MMIILLLFLQKQNLVLESYHQRGQITWLFNLSSEGVVNFYETMELVRRIV
jgi:hypothetical protein